MWKPEKVQDIILNLNELDKISGIQVKLCKDSQYRQYFQRGKIIIDYSGGQLREKSDFLTYSKVQNELADVEKSIVDNEILCYTVTVKEGRILGASTIISLFGNSLQVWENTCNESDDANIKFQKCISGLFYNIDDSRKLEEEIEQRFPEVISDEQELKKNFEEQGQSTDSDKNSKNHIETPDNKESAEEIQNDAIYKIQREAWEKRIKRFDNYDRIALFQFNIDASYYHPSIEICKDFEIKDNFGKSCAEFRRRQILKPVLNACSDFKVEILVLPEYSVRPETVEWIRGEIESLENKFSVWAGTFRIPPEYKFFDEHWNTKLNSHEYWNSAMLPIIEVNEENIVIITEKFKKYPSVALHEDINPFPAVASQANNFEPVIKKVHKNEILKDARDDVTEVICAEMFAVSAVSNAASFLEEFLVSYNRYAPSQLKTEECFEQMAKDILTFGKYTAIYQEKSRYDRTPIILIPACTTRATDYYIWGQGDYLAAGIKTVLCNSTRENATGGSCFIGQDSWDDRKIKCDEKLEHNTLYHGLRPGMYMQTSRDKDRGALGSYEQALLIYDVNPSYDKTNPNAESMRDSLSIVAHIPILEDRVKSELCAKCSCPYLCKLNNQNVVEISAESLINHCIQNELYSTMQEKHADEIGNILDGLGKRYNSKWLCKRGEFYKKYHKIRPQSWPAPTLIDWIQVKIDYNDFVKNDDKYWIQVPEE